MCACPVHASFRYCAADLLAESERVRIHERRETRASCEAFSLAAFEYEFGALDRLDNPITNTYLNLVHVSLLRHPPCFLANL